MKRVALLLLSVLFSCCASALWVDHGTCGHQCTKDADCASGCGSASKCSCPDAGTKYPSISCTCVSRPSTAPQSPAVDINDSVWPAQWTANVSAWVYPDFSDKAARAAGKFYYDGAGGHSRADWTPYTNQKDATQIWIGGTGGAKSHYYVKSGPICIYFPITDPGSVGGPVGVERADWIKNCNASGMAKYVAREQVDVAGKPVWTDHFSCHVDYAEVNQTITFQNWHSLGLDGVDKGLPVRVTGGNSAPNPTKGSPRLSNVWYSDFQTGNSSVSPKDFTKPSWLCIPVGLDAVESFVGHKLTQSHAFDPTFHAKVHALPMALTESTKKAAPTDRDLSRAEQRVPGAAYSGKDFGTAMKGLNAVLEADQGLETRPCDQFDLPELHAVQRVLMEARSPQFQAVYQKNSDTRSLKQGTAAELELEQAAIEDLAREHPEMHTMIRDGVCHETVMWYVHHLSEATKSEVQQFIVLPLLPTKYHTKPALATSASKKGHSRYTSQVSCAVCHVA